MPAVTVLWSNTSVLLRVRIDPFWVSRRAHVFDQFCR